MTKFIITQEQVQGVVNYLVTRPYNEVSKGIEMLTKLPVYEESTERPGEHQNGEAVL